MSEKANKQAQRIRDELQQLERIIEHVKKDWGKFLSTSDDGFLKATAYDLHGFYTGLERIFKTIADTIDDNIPSGEMWHKALLDQMILELEGIRPAVISPRTYETLEDFMRFRHRVRNIYSFNLNPERVRPLVKKLPDAYMQVNNDLSDFAQFLEQVVS